jgi:hypothetical protein
MRQEEGEWKIEAPGTIQETRQDNLASREATALHPATPLMTHRGSTMSLCFDADAPGRSTCERANVLAVSHGNLQNLKSQRPVTRKKNYYSFILGAA